MSTSCFAQFGWNLFCPETLLPRVVYSISHQTSVNVVLPYWLLLKQTQFHDYKERKKAVESHDYTFLMVIVCIILSRNSVISGSRQASIHLLKTLFHIISPSHWKKLLWCKVSHAQAFSVYPIGKSISWLIILIKLYESIKKILTHTEFLRLIENQYFRVQSMWWKSIARSM